MEQYIPGLCLKDQRLQGKRFTESQVRNIAVEILSILNRLGATLLVRRGVELTQVLEEVEG
ncbi:hypothetical protein RintRC_6427 [Richelia intracellularis]|nr:hypothetical protein RintRC_6427 [Richelia intracellularis]